MTLLLNFGVNNMSAGKGAFCAAAFASYSASRFSPLGMCRKEKPAKCFSILLTAARYLISSGSFTVNSFSTCPTTTWESDLIMHLRTPSALSFRKPNNTASYSAMLLVVRNSSLAAYRSLGPLGGVRITDIPAPDMPHALSQCTVQVGSSNWSVVSKAAGV